LTKTSNKITSSLKKGDNATKLETIEKEKHQNDNIYQKGENTTKQKMFGKDKLQNDKLQNDYIHQKTNEAKNG
jgi:hypothetical protein